MRMGHTYSVHSFVAILCTTAVLWSGEMMKPETSKHFVAWRDPGSGVVSYVLQTRVALQQQSFYFVNRSMTTDGRFLWFYCVNPPSNTRTMGVVDFKTDEVRHFPEIRGVGASPYVDLKTGDLYWTTTRGVFRRSPLAAGTTKQLCGVPTSFPKVERRLYQLACHLTRNASETKFLLDARIDNQFVCGDLDIATGHYTEWGRMDVMFNHAQFSPTDDGLVLICKEYWTDAVTGKQRLIPTSADGIYERLWLWRKGEKPKLVPPINGGRATHEWWGADGTSFYYCAYPKYGIGRYDLKTGQQRLVTTNRATHAHSSRDDRYFVFDQHLDPWYRGCAWKVFFYSPASDKTVCMVTHNPAYNTPEKPSTWHPDPHPQFVANDRYIVSTLNIGGAMNLLVTPVAPLMEAVR